MKFATREEKKSKVSVNETFNREAQYNWNKAIVLKVTMLSF